MMVENKVKVFLIKAALIQHLRMVGEATQENNPVFNGGGGNSSPVSDFKEKEKV